MPIVNHKDGNKHNVHVDNLEWVSAKTNSQHAHDMGLNKNTNCVKVSQFSLSGEFIATFDSIVEASKQLGVSIASIKRQVYNNYNPGKSAFIFKRLDKTPEKVECDDTFIDIKNVVGYKINIKGEIFSTRFQRMLNPTTSKTSGYVLVAFYRKFVSLHRLLASHFIPNPMNYKLVNHKDGNKANNDIENLEWCSHSQNTQHAHDNGLIKSKKSVQQLKDGVVIATFDSIVEASKATSTESTNISRVCTGKHKSAGGFQWRFVENPQNIQHDNEHSKSKM